VLSPAPKPAPTFDLASPGLALILTQAIDALDGEDFQARMKLIKSGRASSKAKFVGIDQQTGFASFT
jgi:hypothetical protein